MNHLEKKIIQVNRNSDLPSIQKIKSIPRGTELKIIFVGKIKLKRESIGEKWRKKLPKYLVSIHWNDEEINIYKLITDEEIIENQVFFENCAKEYGELGKKLMKKLENEFDILLVNGRPINMQNTTGKKPYVRSGKMDEWSFTFHGAHCGFKNTLSTSP